MNTKTINISLPPKLVTDLDRLAKKQSANRSELIREAIRRYTEDRKAWEALLAYGRRRAKELGITTEDDVVRLVREVRKEMSQ